MLTKDLSDGEGGGEGFVFGLRCWDSRHLCWPVRGPSKGPPSDRYLALNPPGPGGQPNPLPNSFISSLVYYGRHSVITLPPRKELWKELDIIWVLNNFGFVFLHNLGSLFSCNLLSLERQNVLAHNS